MAPKAWLAFQGHLAHFIQKDRPTIRNFEATYLLHMCL